MCFFQSYILKDVKVEINKIGKFIKSCFQTFQTNEVFTLYI